MQMSVRASIGESYGALITLLTSHGGQKEAYGHRQIQDECRLDRLYDGQFGCNLIKPSNLPMGNGST